MSASGNFVSLFGAAQANGAFIITNPPRFFNDVNTNNLVRVQMGNLTNNTVTPNKTYTGFYITYQEPMKLTLSTYFLPTNPSLLTLTDFLSGLEALNNYRNNFTLYSNLLKTSNQPANYFYGKSATFLQMLINDQFASRNYYAAGNFTRVYVNIFNNAIRFYADFTGDQDYGGNYYYFTKFGNSYI